MRQRGHVLDISWSQAGCGIKLLEGFIEVVGLLQLQGLGKSSFGLLKISLRGIARRVAGRRLGTRQHSQICGSSAARAAAANAAMATAEYPQRMRMLRL